MQGKSESASRIAPGESDAEGRRLFGQFAPGTSRRKGNVRLLNGHALAVAQRLSRQRVKPSVFALVLIFGDVIALLVAGALSLRLVPDLALLQPSQQATLWLGALVTMALLRLLGAYGFKVMRSLWRALAVAFFGLIIGLTSVWLFFSSAGHEVPVVWLVFWGGLAANLMLGLRIYAWIRIRNLTRLGQLEHRIVVVGGGPEVQRVIDEIERERGRGRRMCGFFDDRGWPRAPDVIGKYHKMGDLDDLLEFARLAPIDTVIVAISGASRERLMQLMMKLFVLPVDIRLLDTGDRPDFAQHRRSRIGRLKVVELCKRPLGGAQAFAKRCFDLVFASLLLVMFSPLMALVALLVRLDSPGPVFFQQSRHGYNNRPITVFKFRTMYVEASDTSGVRSVRRGDNRVTRVGRFLRRSSLDELPQFVNVLRGELSLVGPRPHAVAARTGDIIYHAVAESYSARHKVKPGVTGWAQINGWRGELNCDEKIKARVEHDLYYIENWSLWLDLKILILTPWALVTTKNAY